MQVERNHIISRASSRSTTARPMPALPPVTRAVSQEELDRGQGGVAVEDVDPLETDAQRAVDGNEVCQAVAA